MQFPSNNHVFISYSVWLNLCNGLCVVVSELKMTSPYFLGYPGACTNYLKSPGQWRSLIESHPPAYVPHNEPQEISNLADSLRE